MLLSAYLITYNEAHKISDVLQALQGADEIIVVDSGSTDNTVDIAKSFGAKVFHQKFLGYAKQKSYAMSLCSGEWVLSMDGDEVLQDNGILKIKELISNTKCSGFLLPRVEVFFNKKMYLAKPNYFLRLYKKADSKWDEERLVHEHIDVKGSLKKVDIDVIHFGAESVELLLNKINRYSTLKVQQSKGKKSNILKIMFYYMLYFIRYYIGKRYILCGSSGLIYAIFQAWYGFLTQVKFYENR